MSDHRMYYGDPADPVEELAKQDNQGPPQEGDQLCDGHLTHYVWRDGRWQL